eukprot:GFKZ01012074.1.p1 GENE.GFKZ01012074.1~~GFKZ01012074.1.p1  ORF type:complete len:384 (+),score=40.52 GFKZ01012074.1:356-1507(+)
MANGKVDDVAWSQLRPQPNVPQSVLDSIPPEDMQTFLRLMATNPFVPFNDASAIRRKIASVRQWRAESANPNTVTKEFTYVQPTSKRRRDNVAPEGGPRQVSIEGRDTDSEHDQPRRKQRRSTRPTSSNVPKTPPRSKSPQSEDAPKVGPEHQADVPHAPLSAEEWRKSPVKIESPLVFSERSCGGATRVNSFLYTVNEKLRRRDGFNLAPFAAEVALTVLHSNKGDLQKALEQTLREIPRGPYFPGIKGQFKYEEQCLFVRTLAERAKKFTQISREVLPTRSPSELVWLYYTRHKQLWIQNGGMKGGLILDDGGDKLRRVQLTSERTISSLRNLAVTAGDGFPIDSRVNLAVLACRRGNMTKRKRQQDEVARGRTRLRSQQY